MLILLISIRVVGYCNIVDYTSIYKKEVFNMTYEECVDKAHEAVRLGIIEFEKLDEYIDYLYEKHKIVEKTSKNP
jgi:hypothetical protein